MESIASITTAFNAAHILPRQIDALLAQSRPLQEIIVVDNASTDGTSAMLAERYPQVTVLRLEKNVGASGGWAAGLKYAALEKKHDWIWNFDDDSVPRLSTLSSLLAEAGDVTTNPEVGMLVPMPVHDATGSSYPPMFWRDGYVKPSKRILQQPIWFADITVASGCLVRRSVVEKVGVPRADFFMDMFDFEYCLRIRSSGYKIAVITKCTFSHEIGEPRVLNFAGLRYVWQGHAPWREYYITRNLTYTVLSLYPTLRAKFALALLLLRHALVVLVCSDQKAVSLKRIFQGFLDGRRGRLGVRFLA